MKRYRIELTEGEKFIIAIDDHWVSIVGPMAFMALAFGMSALFFVAAFFLSSTHWWVGAGFYLFAGMMALFALHWTFIYLFEWELSTWIVTTRRILNVRFLPYVRHDVGYIMIHEIHEIEKHKRGILKNLLNFGNIEINLAAIPQPTIFRYMPKPSAFANLIQTIHKSSNPDELSVDGLRKLYLM